MADKCDFTKDGEPGAPAPKRKGLIDFSDAFTPDEETKERLEQRRQGIGSRDRKPSDKPRAPRVPRMKAPKIELDMDALSFLDSLTPPSAPPVAPAQPKPAAKPAAKPSRGRAGGKPPKVEPNRVQLKIGKDVRLQVKRAASYVPGNANVELDLRINNKVDNRFQLRYRDPRFDGPGERTGEELDMVLTDFRVNGVDMLGTLENPVQAPAHEILTATALAIHKWLGQPATEAMPARPSPPVPEPEAKENAGEVPLPDAEDTAQAPAEIMPDPPKPAQEEPTEQAAQFAGIYHDLTSFVNTEAYQMTMKHLLEGTYPEVTGNDNHRDTALVLSTISRTMRQLINNDARWNGYREEVFAPERLGELMEIIHKASMKVDTSDFKHTMFDGHLPSLETALIAGYALGPGGLNVVNDGGGVVEALVNKAVATVKESTEPAFLQGVYAPSLSTSRTFFERTNKHLTANALMKSKLGISDNMFHGMFDNLMGTPSRLRRERIGAGLHALSKGMSTYIALVPSNEAHYFAKANLQATTYGERTGTAKVVAIFEQPDNWSWNSTPDDRGATLVIVSQDYQGDDRVQMRGNYTPMEAARALAGTQWAKVRNRGSNRVGARKQIFDILGRREGGELVAPDQSDEEIKGQMSPELVPYFEDAFAEMWNNGEVFRRNDMIHLSIEGFAAYAAVTGDAPLRTLEYLRGDHGYLRPAHAKIWIDYSKQAYPLLAEGIIDPRMAQSVEYVQRVVSKILNYDLFKVYESETVRKDDKERNAKFIDGFMNMMDLAVTLRSDVVEKAMADMHKEVGMDTDLTIEEQDAILLQHLADRFIEKLGLQPRDKSKTFTEMLKLRMLGNRSIKDSEIRLWEMPGGWHNHQNLSQSWGAPAFDLKFQRDTISYEGKREILANILDVVLPLQGVGADSIGAIVNIPASKKMQEVMSQGNGPVNAAENLMKFGSTPEQAITELVRGLHEQEFAYRRTHEFSDALEEALALGRVRQTLMNLSEILEPHFTRIMGDWAEIVFLDRQGTPAVEYNPDKAIVIGPNTTQPAVAGQFFNLVMNSLRGKGEIESSWVTMLQASLAADLSPEALVNSMRASMPEGREMMAKLYKLSLAVKEMAAKWPNIDRVTMSNYLRIHTFQPTEFHQIAESLDYAFRPQEMTGVQPRRFMWRDGFVGLERMAHRAGARVSSSFDNMVNNAFEAMVARKATKLGRSDSLLHNPRLGAEGQVYELAPDTAVRKAYPQSASEQLAHDMIFGLFMENLGYNAQGPEADATGGYHVKDNAMSPLVMPLAELNTKQRCE